MLGVAHDCVRVTGEEFGGELNVALAGEVADRDPRDLEAEPGALLDLIGLRLDERDERSADVAAAEHAEPDRVSSHDL